MAVATITINTADLGLGVVAADVTAVLVSAAAQINNGTAFIQRSLGPIGVVGSGSIGLEGNAALNDPASTYTITVGDVVCAGIVVPNDGGTHALLALLPTAPVRTVNVTAKVWDPGDGPAQVQAAAVLSVDCRNQDGVLIVGGAAVAAEEDSLGNLIFAVERTDRLTPLDGSAEPYYTWSIGASTITSYVHGAGSLLDTGVCPRVVPDSSVGSGVLDQAGLPADPTFLTGSFAFPGVSLRDELRREFQRLETTIVAVALLRLRGPAGRYTLGDFGVFV